MQIKSQRLIYYEWIFNIYYIYVVASAIKRFKVVWAVSSTENCRKQKKINFVNINHFLIWWFYFFHFLIFP